MGQPLESHTPLLQTFADQLEAELPSTHIQPPELRKGATLAWPGLIRLTRAFVDILTTSDVPLELRLRRMVTLARACRDANLHQLDLPKLSEFLTIMTAVAEESTSLEKLPSPSWVTRMLFRQQLALYARKDKGRHAGDAPKSRWFRWQSAWRFARWEGLIPRLHAAIPAVRFQDVEAVQITPNRTTWETLERYYVVKLVSFQFFGPMNFHRHYFDGLDSLLLTFPAIGWLARIFAWSHERSPDDAVSLALQAVDDNFGFHPLLGASWQTWANRTITERGDLARLIAWYAPQQIPRS
jgi:lysine-N-methylase